MQNAEFSLLVTVDGVIPWHRARLRVTEDGRLAWGDDPRRAGRALADLRAIRLWCEKPKLTWPVGRAELRFADGLRLRVSGGAFTGSPDAVSARTYLNFLRHLHAALGATEPSHVSFRRGFPGGSPLRGWMVGIFLACLDIGLVAWLLINMRADAQAFVTPAIILFGAAGLLGAAGAGQVFAGRQYDPDRIPPDLTPLQHSDRVAEKI
jgi:hypothetical protein